MSMKTYINGHCIEQVLTNAVELTTAQYNALPEAQKSSGTYIITDAEAPNISASNVSYDMGGGITTDVQTAITSLANSLSVGTINQDVVVTANTHTQTDIDWTGIDRSKVLYSWIWWSNTNNDVPTYVTKYYNSSNPATLNSVQHKWDTDQTVRFKIQYIIKN